MSTSDRELLELAAKAAGIDLKWKLGIHQITLPPACPYYDVGGLDKHWNPFADDGDALRLAVKIRLLVDVCNSYTGVCNEKVDPIEQDHGNDAFAATRRAIVRAAAEIGRSMP